MAGDNEGALDALRREYSELESESLDLEVRKIHDNVTKRWKNIGDQAGLLNTFGRYQEAIELCESYLQRYEKDFDLLRRYYAWQRKKLKPTDYPEWKKGSPLSYMSQARGRLHEQLMRAHFELQDPENTYRYAALLLEGMSS